ncbi:MAG: recombinase family protein [Deltaproteobacteria bacterium]|nr:recombinase family protein [Deltaproteobacteria bacterium]
MRRTRPRQPASGRRAIAYCRVSTEEQASGGVSMEAQERALRAYCEMRGLELDMVVQDPGVSAGRPFAERPGGNLVRERVDRGEVGAVIAWKLDRLFRDAGDCLNTTRGWDQRGVALHLVDLGGQAVDTTSAMGRFFLTVMAAGAEMERNLVSERTKFALASKKAKGERVGRIPLGQRLSADGKHLEPDSGELDTISLVKKLYAEGWTQRQIADHLNALGKRVRGRRCVSSPWRQPTISRLLRREGN